MEINSDILRGNLDTILLAFLRDGDKYGYQICKLAKEKCGGEFEIKEPSLYSTIRRLEAQGCIEGYWGDESGGGRRRYFRITEKGIEKYHHNLLNWEFAKRMIDILLEG